MGPSMMHRFAEANFQPIDVDGVLVHPMLRVKVSSGDVLRLTWLSAGSPRVQGVALRLRLPEVPGRGGEGGLLRVESAESPAILLWMDTAPPVVEVTCVKVFEGAQLQISNRWRAENGREDEWLNNYGMVIDEVAAGSYVLLCSDGHGAEPSFDDLVVRVDVVADHAREPSSA